MDLQPMTTSYCRHSPSLSREGNVSHASVNQLLYSYPLQEENIPLHTVPNSIGICRQQTKFATFTLSLQNGKRFACFPLVQLFPFYRKTFCILPLITFLFFPHRQQTTFAPFILFPERERGCMPHLRAALGF